MKEIRREKINHVFQASKITDGTPYLIPDINFEKKNGKNKK